MSSLKLGSLDSLLNKETLKQMKSSMGRKPTKSQRTEMIKFEKIFPNPKNEEIYSVDSVSALAANIETHGLIQPLVVRPQKSHDQDDEPDSKYILISGHRRRMAILKLMENHSQRASELDYIPCLVMEPSENEDDELELLIDSNISSREKSDAEKAREIAAKKEILARRRERGETICGKSIDIIAEEMGISLHQAKKLNAINMNASEPVKDAFEKGEISVQTAYELSKADEDTQKSVIDSSKDSNQPLTAQKVKAEVNKTKKKTTQKSNPVHSTPPVPYGENASKASSDDIKPDTANGSHPNNEMNEEFSSATSTPSQNKFDIISSLAALIKRFAPSDSNVSLTPQEVEVIQATLNQVYMYVEHH